MSDLPAFVVDLLDNCPRAGSGVNKWLFTTGRHLHAHLDGRTMHAVLKEKSSGCGRMVKDSEIAHQVRASRRTAWCPNNPHLFANGHSLEGYEPPPDSPKWPKPEIDEIRRIVSLGFHLSTLIKLSPVKLDPAVNHAEEIIDGVWPGNPLLCCGKSSYQFATRRRDVWRGHVARCAYIVPNPMLRMNGVTAEGKESEHSLEATAARIYQAIEFDFSEFTVDGTETAWAPLVREWREKNITVADACAALHLHLSFVRPLVLVTHSGGKSLHGWYACYDRIEEQNLEFMRYAVSVGADSATWLRSQFVRMPDGTRENGERQSALYLNPGEAVKV